MKKIPGVVRITSSTRVIIAAQHAQHGSMLQSRIEG
jgi:hypothetical protein